MKLSRLFSVALLPAYLAACSQPEPVGQIYGQMTFNKLGEGGCEEGIYIAGAPQQYQCPIPDDNCDLRLQQFDPDCRPPGRDPNQPGTNNNPVPGNPNLRDRP